MGRGVGRGDIRWYRFKDPDKERPVLVLTRDSGLRLLREATVAPITSTVRNIPTEVVLGTEDGMPRKCAINLDHVQTVSLTRLGELITVFPADRMGEVREALLFALGFPLIALGSP